MTSQLPLMDGFGKRLKDERERVGLTQAKLAEAAGIKRLAQSQYEAEVRSPTVRYLFAISNVGLDVMFLLFAQRGQKPVEAKRAIEKKAFELVEMYAQQQPDGRFGFEGRFAMFELIRAHMSQCDAAGTALPATTAELLSTFHIP